MFHLNLSLTFRNVLVIIKRTLCVCLTLDCFSSFVVFVHYEIVIYYGNSLLEILYYLIVLPSAVLSIKESSSAVTFHEGRLKSQNAKKFAK